jgi:hypothetical protein
MGVGHDPAPRRRAPSQKRGVLGMKGGGSAGGTPKRGNFGRGLLRIVLSETECAARGLVHLAGCGKSLPSLILSQGESCLHT